MPEASLHILLEAMGLLCLSVESCEVKGPHRTPGIMSAFRDSNNPVRFPICTVSFFEFLAFFAKLNYELFMKVKKLGVA